MVIIGNFFRPAPLKIEVFCWSVLRGLVQERLLRCQGDPCGPQKAHGPGACALLEHRKSEGGKN